MCGSVCLSICVSCVFSVALSLLFVSFILFWFILILFYFILSYYSLEAVFFFFRPDRVWIELGGEDLGKFRGEEYRNRIYFINKMYFQFYAQYRNTLIRTGI